MLRVNKKSWWLNKFKSEKRIRQPYKIQKHVKLNEKKTLQIIYRNKLLITLVRVAQILRQYRL